jgi:hypothetical protein
LWVPRHLDGFDHHLGLSIEIRPSVKALLSRKMARLGDGSLHSASLVLAQTGFEEIERNQREGRVGSGR